MKVFYLGGKPGVAGEGARRLKAKVAGLQMETHHGYFQKFGNDNANVIGLIHAYNPDVLMVGMGMPLQEHWVLGNLDRLTASAILCSVACLDYIAGRIPSAPRWMGKIGIEWLFRLYSEPIRLWRRYLIEPWFIARLLVKEKFQSKS